MTGKILFITLVLIGSCLAEKLMEVVDDSTFLFKGESGKTDYTQLLKKGQIVSLLPQEDNAFQLRLKVKTWNGRVGWVSKNAMEKTEKNPDLQNFSMEERKILGFLEMPQAVYILDISDTSVVPILLHRSFQDMLITRIDRETFARLYDPVIAAEQ